MRSSFLRVCLRRGSFSSQFSRTRYIAHLNSPGIVKSGLDCCISRSWSSKFDCVHNDRYIICRSFSSNENTTRNSDDNGELDRDKKFPKNELEENDDHLISEAQKEAFHELYHRAKHVGAVEGSKIWSEKLVQKIEKISSSGMQRGIKETLERAAEKAGDHVLDQTSVRASNKVLRRKAMQAAERTSAHATTERVAERASKLLGEKVREELLEQSSERGSEMILDRLVGKAGDRIIDTGTKKGLERAFEEAGEKVIERSSEHGSKIIPGGLIHKLENRFGRIAEQGAERTTEKATQIAERRGKSAIERRVLASTRRMLVLKRLGRGLLIAVPVLGGIFSAYVCHSDIQRMEEERRKQRRNNTWIWMVFAGAAIADGLDTICHFGIAYALVSDLLSHQDMLLLEQISMLCAFGSTVCAVGGEIACQRTQQKKLQKE